jgi:hypothetical protein
MENRKIDYLLVGIVVALTGFEFAYRTPLIIQFCIMTGIAIYFFRIGRRFSNISLIILAPFLTSYLLQAIQFPNLYILIAQSLFMFIKFMICYLVIEIVKYRFNFTYVKLIYFLALVSFIFYPTQFNMGLQESIKNSIGSIIKPIGLQEDSIEIGKTLILFNYHFNMGPGYDGLQRNCGPFWEPGMFAVFINIALLINLYINKASLFSRVNIVLIIALITTLSTTGIIVLFLIIISKFILDKRVELAILYIPVVFAIVFIAYINLWKLDFIGEKITSQIDNASYTPYSRFGAALYHFEALKRSPLSGVALFPEETDKDIGENRIVTPNGISLIFYAYGIPVGLLYYLIFYISLSRWLRYNGIDNRMIHLFFFFVFILSVFSQDVTNRHFYFMFLFLMACFPRYPIPKGIKVFKDNTPDIGFLKT